MAELYPAINNKFEKGPFSFKPTDNIIRTKFSNGPPQTRRRTTKRVDNLGGVIRFTKNELDTFETWYESTLKDGSLSFIFKHPIKNTDIEVKFTKPYSYRAIGFDTYDVTIELETL